MCGVVGIVNRSEAVSWSARGLYALQHRGHDSCGVAYVDSSGFLGVTAGQGAVADVLQTHITAEIISRSAIGQNLYTTYGNSHSVQPFRGKFWDGAGEHSMAVAHNGQLANIATLRRKYPVMYTTESDSEIIFSLLPHMPGKDIPEKVFHLLQELEGAFSLLFLWEGGIIAARDPDGFRPLIYGNDDAGAVMFASEVNAFDIMEGHFVRQVEPGEMIKVNTKGEISTSSFAERKENLHQCVFEHIYFARPDNQLFGKAGYSTQKSLGRQTAKEVKGKIEADIVISVPDSANIATLGFASEFGLPYEIGLLRHHFASRTFITRGQKNREKAVRQKFNVVKDVVQGKRIILGDDSVVRSTTSRILTNILREGGAKEIHMVLFSPFIAYSCIYGINTPTREELIAFQCDSNSEKIAREIGADSVNYLSLDGLHTVMNPNPQDYCYACMTGEYPISPC